MRIVIALCAVILFCGPALAQGPWSYVSFQFPSDDIIIVIHPTMDARIYIDSFGPDENSFDVQVGHSQPDPWGMCFFDGAMPEAEELLVLPAVEVPDLNLMETTLILDNPPSSDDGETTVSFMGLRGGGHTSGEGADFIATVLGYDGCFFENLFTVTMRSPDINGDLVVNLSDVVRFTQVLHSGQYADWADFSPDGVINLSDITVMAMGLFGP